MPFKQIITIVYIKKLKGFIYNFIHPAGMQEVILKRLVASIMQFITGGFFIRNLFYDQSISRVFRAILK